MPELSLWSFAYGYWTWRLEDAAFLRMEDLLRAPEITLRPVAERGGLTRKAEPFRTPQKRLGPDKRRKRGGWTDIYRREIEGRRYLHHYRPEMIAFVREKIDPLVFGMFGYEWPEKGRGIELVKRLESLGYV